MFHHYLFKFIFSERLKKILFTGFCVYALLFLPPCVLFPMIFPEVSFSLKVQLVWELVVRVSKAGCVIRPGRLVILASSRGRELWHLFFKPPTLRMKNACLKLSQGGLGNHLCLCLRYLSLDLTGRASDRRCRTPLPPHRLPRKP